MNINLPRFEFEIYEISRTVFSTVYNVFCISMHGRIQTIFQYSRFCLSSGFLVMADFGFGVFWVIFDLLITQSVFGLDIKYDPSKFII